MLLFFSFCHFEFSITCTYFVTYFAKKKLVCILNHPGLRPSAQEAWPCDRPVDGPAGDCGGVGPGPHPGGGRQGRAQRQATPAVLRRHQGERE